MRLLHPFRLFGTAFRALRHIPWGALRTRLYLAGIAALVMFLVPGATPAGNRLDERVLGHARDVLFSHVGWEVEAVLHKVRQVHSGLAPFLSEAERSAFVSAYLARVAELQTLEQEIARLYSDPGILDAEAAAAPHRARRDALRAEIELQQPLAEAIAETQVAAVLRDEGFAVLGEVFPPVSARITELPMLLVISPREVIRRELTVNVVYLSADEMTALEDQIDRDLNVSSLVVPLGGLALYPSMILQTWHAPLLFELIAHEWAHHYLYFFPLGWEYMDTSREAWIINETVASLFGRLVARKTIERFYADYPDMLRLLPPEPEPPADSAPEPAPDPAPEPAPPEPPAFSAAAALDETRRAVDALLAAGQIEEAEAYMAERRRYLAENGAVYRKLNQAFFAFYGGYQAPGGGGAAGADPIGPAVAEIWSRSGSLRAWMEAVRGITSREALLAARDALRGAGTANDR